jgi:hypothetical protein
MSPAKQKRDWMPMVSPSYALATLEACDGEAALLPSPTQGTIKIGRYWCRWAGFFAFFSFPTFHSWLHFNHKFLRGILLKTN